jgi:hypothetical protein
MGQTAIAVPNGAIAPMPVVYSQIHDASLDRAITWCSTASLCGMWSICGGAPLSNRDQHPPQGYCYLLPGMRY